MSNKTWLGHLACFTAYLIFGFNIIVCKDLTAANEISPLALFSMRAAGAALLFWLVGAFLPSERVERRDFPKILIASMLGLFLTQFAFLVGIRQCTPMDWAILSVLSPIFTMFVAAVAVKEPITLKKAGGVVISFAGVTALILSSSHSGGAEHTTVFGVLMSFVNCLSFAMYLGIFRPLIQKYSVVTFMKWMFLFSLCVSLPFSARELAGINYAAIPALHWWELAFLIVFSTFVAYFLIPVGQKHIRPTAVSLYSYLQPIIASCISIWIGMDRFTPLKIVSAVAVVAGVVLVNRSRAKDN